MGKNDSLSRGERLQIMLSQEELEAVDDFSLQAANAKSCRCCA